MNSSFLVSEDHTHLGLEVALGKFLWLISWCTRSPASSREPDGDMGAESPSSADSLGSNSRVMAFNIIMETVLSDKVRGFFVPSLSCPRRRVSSPAPPQAVTHSDLLGTYSSLPTQLSPSKFSDKRESLVKHNHRDLVVSWWVQDRHCGWQMHGVIVGKGLSLCILLLVG